ncbi:MAG: hypothetical protein EOM68_18485 [Spirochaetia bacterium]|nr:hypothetical protein [Spirochaetia bacterium]
MIKVTSDIMGHEIKMVNEWPVESEKFKGKVVSYILKDTTRGKTKTIVAKQFVKDEDAKEVFSTGDTVLFSGYVQEHRRRDKTTGEWQSEGLELILDEVLKVEPMESVDGAE